MVRLGVEPCRGCILAEGLKIEFFGIQWKNYCEHERMAAEILAVRTEGDEQEKVSFVCTIDSKTQVFNNTLVHASDLNFSGTTNMCKT